MPQIASRSDPATRTIFEATTGLPLPGGSTAPKPPAGVVALPALKAPPNPYGKKGGPAHQAKIAEVEADIRTRGLTPQREFRVDTPDGSKRYRSVDVVALDLEGKVVEMHQVGRQTKSGKPVAREAKAMADIEAASGTKPQYHAYNEPK